MKAYLLLYNFSQLLCNGSLFILCLLYGPVGFYNSPNVEFILKFSQTFMILEVVHCLIKISPSPLIPTFLQIVSRVWVVFGVMDLARESFWIFMVSLMWSMAETVRYSHYIAMYFKKTPKSLLWARYSGFIALYPVGVFSELRVLYDAYPVIEKCCPRVFSFEMPNEWNFSFDYLYVIWMFALPGYVFGFPFLYSYMLSQRKRKLNKLD